MPVDRIPRDNVVLWEVGRECVLPPNSQLGRIMMEFQETASIPKILATAVGSLPHADSTEAVEMILGALASAPHAPQLARRDPREQMWIQFTEGLPRFQVDLEKLSYFFDTSGDTLAEMEAFYAHYLEAAEGGPVDAFAIGPEYGQGIHHFAEKVAQTGKKFPFIKAQVTGPLSFAMTVTDENKRPIFFHDTFRDIAVKAMGLKAAWLVDHFKQYADEVIIFFDEPAMSAYGSSAWLGVSQADVTESLDDVISLCAQRGAIAGVHCCGNTDWGLLMETITRIINFDAVDYMESVVIYADRLARFLERGGVLAWGAVPNDHRAEKESAADVVRRVEDGIEQLERAGIDRSLLRRSNILTPACGCAGLEISQAKRAYALLAESELALAEAL